MGESVDEQRVAAAKTQAMFREVNERIEGMNEEWATVLPVGEWICECADRGCVERVEMALAEYEYVRAHPNRFFVAPGHELPVVEEAVEANERYVVVAKLAPGDEVAVAADPRSHPTGGLTKQEIARARNEARRGRHEAATKQSTDLPSA
jgi:hypothetical protein